MALLRPEGYGCDCTTDACGRELGMKFGDDFLCLAYDERLGTAAGEGVPWHWHDELELIYMVSGSARLRASGGSVVLTEGDSAFINRRAFHMLNGAPDAHIRSMVFDPHLVTGVGSSIFARRYIDPIIMADGMRFLIWHAGTDADADEVGHHLTRAIDAMEFEEDGFEFAVRDGLSRCLLAAWKRLDKDEERAADAGEQRIELMCEFIERHYAEPIKVADIAAAAGISERECLRCFRSALGESPSRFLTIRRLAHAAYLLANRPNLAISEVARAAGIPNASNFAQLFRRDYGSTPHAYRMRTRRAAQSG